MRTNQWMGHPITAVYVTSIILYPGVFPQLPGDKGENYQAEEVASHAQALLHLPTQPRIEEIDRNVVTSMLSMGKAQENHDHQ